MFRGDAEVRGSGICSLSCRGSIEVRGSGICSLSFSGRALRYGVLVFVLCRAQGEH